MFMPRVANHDPSSELPYMNLYDLIAVTVRTYGHGHFLIQGGKRTIPLT
jgi:hypothetical protein